ncbi:MAG TPA: Hsp20/alpha crystallin family protein [Steroidobacteraceae bacterium]|nr:Hsp20/alpha crystallin family protein [Steroidobacteraceae bacterium]
MNVEGPHWMWLQALAIAEEAERLQRGFVRYLGRGEQAVSWEPPVDIYECDEGVVLLLALPGVAPEDIEIRLENAALTVSATRLVSCPPDGSLIRRLEIPHGRFVRRIMLAGPTRIAESRYRNGCLEIRLVPTVSGE